MTITRALRNLGWIVSFLLAGWTAQAYAQQSPVSAASVAGAARPASVNAARSGAAASGTRVVKAPATAADGAKTAPTAPAAVAEADTTRTAPRPQQRPRAPLDQYRNAVTPPVENGR